MLLEVSQLPCLYILPSSCTLNSYVFCLDGAVGGTHFLLCSCDMSANTVAANAICAALFSRAGDGKFHWSIIIPSSNGNAVVIHATNDRGGGWFYERKAHKSIYNSATICVLVQIGACARRFPVLRLCSES